MYPGHGVMDEKAILSSLCACWTPAVLEVFQDHADEILLVVVL
jgi:hypothetical protein